jgi:hypothetical protein
MDNHVLAPGASLQFLKRQLCTREAGAQTTKAEGPKLTTLHAESDTNRQPLSFSEKDDISAGGHS